VRYDLVEVKRSRSEEGKRLPMGGFLEVLGVAAFGAIVGATFTWWNSRRAIQVKTAFDMHSEYFGPLVPARESAVRFIAEHKTDGDLAVLWRTVDHDDMRPVWQLVYFYERLWAALKHGYIKPKLVLELFGDNLYYWHEECFRMQLVPVDDSTARHIADLFERLEKEASEQQKAAWENYREVWQLDPKQEGN
jgi:hypothetical protein